MEREKFLEKSHNAEKLKLGTLWGFSTSILSQNIKKLKGENFYFRKKSHNAEKMKGGTLRDFSTSILSENSKKMKGRPFLGKKFSKKSLAMQKKIEIGGPFGLARYCMLRGKQRKNLFGSVR